MKKNKICLITFHTPINYGAVLQAYSLQKYLEIYSDDVKIIDYNTEHLRSLYPLCVKPCSLKESILFLVNLLYLRKKRSKFSKFSYFVANKLSLTKRYESFADLYNAPPEADYYFTGSDQVFNPGRIKEERRAFYLNFGSHETKRIAYAASFGVGSVPNEKRNEISSYISEFYRVSVRENDSVKIFDELGLDKPYVVLDPVFLNDIDFWRENSEAYPIFKERYLLYYRLMNSAAGDYAARTAAKKKGLKLIVVTDGFLKWRADSVLRDVGPSELIYLIDNAEDIVTDSFHGVAFSIIFQKQFLLSDFSPTISRRAMNLMEMLNIEQCACLNGNTGDAEIDYSNVNVLLNKYISKSKLFIEDTFK